MNRMIKQRTNIIPAICIFLFLSLAIHANAFPKTFINFRDAVYMQSETLQNTMRLYAAAKQEIERTMSGIDKYFALSRCEYLMGITFKAAGRDNEAAAFFEQGIVWAEESLAICPTSEGYQLLGTNISFLCEVRRSYGLRNVGKIDENANKALELDPDNLMALHLIASKYITAPWPYGNVRKGVAILEEITRQNYMDLEDEDMFGLFLMLEAACLKQKKNQEAQIWREKAATIYPGNNFISLLLKAN